MRLRTRSRQDEAFDGLTAEDIRRIRELDTVPAPGRSIARRRPDLGQEWERTPLVEKPKNKRGRRA